ncbi:MAG: hypothetical protein JWM11_5236 [Planctomycetaceae bacterium]|nr:hypothetical protein [Planctomycetaceae bacterium]
MFAPARHVTAQISPEGQARFAERRKNLNQQLFAGPTDPKERKVIDSIRQALSSVVPQATQHEFQRINEEGLKAVLNAIQSRQPSTPVNQALTSENLRLVKAFLDSDSTDLASRKEALLWHLSQQPAPDFCPALITRHGVMAAPANSSIVKSDQCSPLVEVNPGQAANSNPSAGTWSLSNSSFEDVVNFTRVGYGFHLSGRDPRLRIQVNPWLQAVQFSANAQAGGNSDAFSTGKIQVTIAGNNGAFNELDIDLWNLSVSTPINGDRRFANAGNTLQLINNNLSLSGSTDYDVEVVLQVETYGQSTAFLRGWSLGFASANVTSHFIVVSEFV